MDREPTAQLLWRRRTTTVERHVTTSEGHLSLSLRVDEVAVSAVAGAPSAAAMESYAELELGAHVAEMRSASQRVQAAPSDRSPLSVALVPGTSRWTSVTPLS
jgi:hypothetical protein